MIFLIRADVLVSGVPESEAIRKYFLPKRKKEPLPQSCLEERQRLLRIVFRNNVSLNQDKVRLSSGVIAKDDRHGTPVLVSSPASSSAVGEDVIRPEEMPRHGLVPM